MEPTLRHGEWLLVDPAAFAEDAPAVGDLVLAHDPRAAGRLILKRVAATARDGTLTLAGDHPGHGRELELGAVDLSAVVGRPWLRYRPLARFGRLR